MIASSIDFAAKAVVFSVCISYWKGPMNSKQHQEQGVEIFCFFIIPFLVNFLNVRLYGWIEYVATTIKLYTIWVVIIVGFVIVAGGSPQLLRGLDGQDNVVPCGSANQVGVCVPSPGLSCIRHSDILLTSKYGMYLQQRHGSGVPLQQ
jgi:amino acid transporter